MILTLPADSIAAQEVGPLSGVTVDEDHVRNFYTHIGWDVETSKPSRELLEKLGGIDDVIENLYT